MGYDASVIAVIGVKVEKGTKNHTATKYNQDTGEPYEIEVSQDVVSVGSHDWPVDEVFEDNKYFGMEFFGTHSESGPQYFGVRIGRHVTLPQLSEAWEKASKAFTQMGYGGEIKLHTYLYESF